MLSSQQQCAQFKQSKAATVYTHPGVYTDPDLYAPCNSLSSGWIGPLQQRSYGTSKTAVFLLAVFSSDASLHR